jgi:GST-like protein
MIELFTANTPNGKKISIMLEEIKYDYKVTLVDISKDDQFKPDFKIVNQWLMAQMAYIGPMLGQHHQFHHYNPGKSQFGEERYFKVCTRIYKELDERLSKVDYLAGNFYSIADIATFPWIARHDWHDIGLKNYTNLSRWYKLISQRDAVQKGYDLFEKNEKVPVI